MNERTNIKTTNKDEIITNLNFINTHWDIQSKPTIHKNEPSSRQGLLSKFQNILISRLFSHVDSIANQQAIFNSFVSQTLNQFNVLILENNEKQSQEIKDLFAKITTIENELIEQINHLSQAVQSFEGRYSDTLTELQHRMHAVETTEQANLDNLCQRVQEIYSEINTLKQTINEIDNSLKPRISTNPAGGIIPKRDRFNYFEFEEVFRGSEDLIKQRQRQYIPYFKEKEKIVDLGSGRGEFLEVMREAGINGIGIDCNQDMIARCEAKGFVVVQNDIFQYLESVPDESIDGIFSAQVIEHLPFEKLDGLFRLAYKKLKPEGILVIETVNPYNLSAFRAFYLDPSHQKPLFPEIISYLCRSSGFNDITIKFISTDTCLSQDASPEKNAQWSCGDYAIIAKK
jgi:2-polyprenyl-3-methyl-5-hydroxy-6-metoxy-1,4-benzoquinol methylase